MLKYTITQFRNDYPNDEACLDKIFQLRFANLVCPRCENCKPFVRVKDRRAYYCPSCGFQIYPTKDTVFEKSTTPLTHWFYAIYLQTTTRNGVAAKELERQLNVCYKTALRMAHQIKKMMANNTDLLSGTVEADECFIGGKAKNMTVWKRKSMTMQQHAERKTVVFGMVEREGNLIAKVVDAASSKKVQPVIRENLEDCSMLFTDTSPIYKGLSKDYFHHAINHEVDEYVRGIVHTNTIEGFWSQLKRTIKGTHIHVSPKHLQKYVDEVAFRWMNRYKQDKMFELILSRVAS